MAAVRRMRRAGRGRVRVGGGAVAQADELEVLADGEGGEEGVLAEVAGDVGAEGGGARVGRVPQDGEPPAERGQQAAGGAQQGGLARAVDPDEEEGLAALEGEGGRRAHGHLVVADDEVARGDDGLHARSVPRARPRGIGRQDDARCSLPRALSRRCSGYREALCGRQGHPGGLAPRRPSASGRGSLRGSAQPDDAVIGARDPVLTQAHVSANGRGHRPDARPPDLRVLLCVRACGRRRRQ